MMVVMASALAFAEGRPALAWPLSAPRRPTQIMTMTLTTMILKVHCKVLIPDMKMMRNTRNTTVMVAVVVMMKWMMHGPVQTTWNQWQLASQSCHAVHL